MIVNVCEDNFEKKYETELLPFRKILISSLNDIFDPDNYLCAIIINAKLTKISFLLRLFLNGI